MKRVKRAKWVLGFVLTMAVTLGVLALTSAVGSAQTRHKGGAGKGGKPRITKPVRETATSADTVDASAPRSAPAAVVGRETLGDAGVVDVKTLDSGTKVLRFGELEIEGRLRSPQIVYFLRRVRAEFAAEDLGHRSFLRELSETRRDPNFTGE
ncbi:hypothetical protein [Pendulispora albinea]|uniref:Uncharacterized protein n=1 Tax=Pendulispora albinea TaxID=2741071 RepID=A0ABZ2LX89_9BACT